MPIIVHDPSKLIKSIARKVPNAKEVLLWMFGATPWIIEIKGDVSRTQFNKELTLYTKKHPGSKKNLERAIVWIREGTLTLKGKAKK